MNTEPITTEAEYDKALAELSSIFQAAPNTPEGDTYSTLVDLIEAYEQEHYPIPPPDPISMLEHYLENRGVSEADLMSYIGTMEEVTAVLHRKQALTLEMIRALHTGLGIAAEILIQPYDLVPHAHSSNGAEERTPVSFVSDTSSLAAPS